MFFTGGGSVNIQYKCPAHWTFDIPFCWCVIVSERQNLSVLFWNDKRYISKCLDSSRVARCFFPVYYIDIFWMQSYPKSVWTIKKPWICSEWILLHLRIKKTRWIQIHQNHEKISNSEKKPMKTVWCSGAHFFTIMIDFLSLKSHLDRSIPAWICNECTFKWN